MIDRQSRDVAAMLLRRLISGRITSDEFEDQLAVLPDSDPVIGIIGEMGWLLYDDFGPRRLVGRHRVSPFDRKEVVRWLLFLDSDYEYVWPDIRLPGIDPLRRVRWAPWLRPFSDYVSKKQADAFLAAGDYFAWPFASRTQFKHTLRNPRRLSGKRRPSDLLTAS